MIGDGGYMLKTIMFMCPQHNTLRIGAVSTATMLRSMGVS